MGHILFILRSLWGILVSCKADPVVDHFLPGILGYHFLLFLHIKCRINSSSFRKKKKTAVTLLGSLSLITWGEAWRSIIFLKVTSPMKEHWIIICSKLLLHPSWRMMLWKCCTQYASKFGKLSSGHRTGKSQFSFQSQRKAMPKNAQTTTQLHSPHTLVK